VVEPEGGTTNNKFLAIILFMALAVTLSGLFFLEAGREQNEESDINVRVLFPDGGEVLSGFADITWNATSRDNRTLTITIQYTTDPESTCASCPPQRWHDITRDEENDGVFSWDTTQHDNRGDYMIRIEASDGVERASDRSGSTFEIKN